MVNPAIFKAYDIRATYPVDINEEVTEQVTRGIFTFFSRVLKNPHPTICVGRDMRISSPSLYAVVVETLVKQGAHVVELGLVATPSVYFALREFEYDAGIQVSASHNPKEYNGIKFAYRKGNTVVKVGTTTGMNEVKKIVLDNTFEEFNEGGSKKEQLDVLSIEVQNAIKSVQPQQIHNRIIVADPANAMGILPLTELFLQLETPITMMNETLDGTFPAHQADPLQHKTLVSLQNKVKELDADIGIAMDGDADRVMFINEKGEIIPATLITALVAKEVLLKKPGELILVDVRYVRNVENIVKQLGGKVHYSKIGHSLITAQMNEEGAVFAGESSGHYYFSEMGGAESALMVILFVLNAMMRENKPISKVVRSLRSSLESGESNYKLPQACSKDEILTRLKSLFPNGTINSLDGVAIDFPNWRFSVRFSNTEPLMRLNVEANSQELLDQNTRKLTTFLDSLGATLKD